MGCSWAPQQMQGGIEGRVGLFSLMERAGTLRGGFRGNGPWFRGGVGAGGFSRLGLPKPDFRLGKHLSMGRGGRVWALEGGVQRAWILGTVVNPGVAESRRKGQIPLPGLRLPSGLLLTGGLSWQD